jgi:hypothetical protein
MLQVLQGSGLEFCMLQGSGLEFCSMLQGSGLEFCSVNCRGAVFSFSSLMQNSRPDPTAHKIQDLTPLLMTPLLKARLTELTARNRTWQPIDDIVDTVNQTLRGWSVYFHYRNSYAAFSKVKRHAEERLRTHLRKRHKIKDRGMGLHRFPNRVLYAQYGLHKLPTTAGWKSAHA